MYNCDSGFKSFSGTFEVITVLFDIDGTLLRSCGAGNLAIRRAMNELFGVRDPIEVSVHGRTDTSIFGDLFAGHQLAFHEHRTSFEKKYWGFLAPALSESNARLLPGVNDLIKKIDSHPHIAQGILTGNSKQAAKIKLAHFQLDHFFKFGGYGDLHANRDDVASLALESAGSWIGFQFEADDVWVVGDTVHDVTCAQSIGANAIAVATGGASKEELASANPDMLLDDLSDTEGFVNSLLSW
ncbi:MAG: HAD hydrolase-like protein [Planctomycetota bacterium]